MVIMVPSIDGMKSYFIGGDDGTKSECERER